jgi:hypothetical protein
MTLPGVKVLHRFGPTDYPGGGLCALGGALYGVTVNGGTVSVGSIFKFTGPGT